MTFPDPRDPAIVYVETRAQGLLLGEPDKVQDYSQGLSRLFDLAANQADSMYILEATRKEFG